MINLRFTRSTSYHTNYHGWILADSEGLITPAIARPGVWRCVVSRIIDSEKDSEFPYLSARFNDKEETWTFWNTKDHNGPEDFLRINKSAAIILANQIIERLNHEMVKQLFPKSYKDRFFKLSERGNRPIRYV